ncbi:vascular cell adhesion protein 1b isoform X2 [Brachyhypopomus gauderio]|uniref:vascular cell adhesion protein 1b isoform X2 n=1 Tax=Brachyhypopomus gauderio TaxID=698409 RepID=UPI0040410EEA
MVPFLSAILLLILPFVAGLRLQLSPKNALFKVGDRQQLTCSMMDCAEDATYTWKSLEDKPLYGDVRPSPTESVLVFGNITKDHENKIVCVAKCKDALKQATAKVKVYSFPKDPVISGHGRLLLGKENNVTCEVSDVYPAENVRIDWIRGDSVVHTQEYQHYTETIESIYTFTPQSDDDGRQITCRASLELDGLPPDQSTRETNVSMDVLSAPHNVRASGPHTVQVGSDISLACEADGNPKPVLSWRVLGHVDQLDEVIEGREFLLLNVSLSDAGDYECIAVNTLGEKTSTVAVVVHGPPVNTVISVSPSEPKEQGFLNISCMSNSVPKSRLVLIKMLNGRETELASNNGPEVSFFYHSVNVSDSGLYVCKAVNDYGDQADSVHVSIETYPLEVSLQPPGSVVSIGSPVTLTCQATGCPHPVFTWKGQHDQPLHRQSDVVSQLGPWPVALRDEGAFICEVTCGSVVKSKRTEVKVFSFSSHPTIESSGPFLEGKTTNLTCTVQEVFPSNHFNFLWLDGETELHSETGHFSTGLQALSSTIFYLPDGRDQEKTITCKVSLDMVGVPAASAEKTTSITMDVHYAPRQTSITVSPQERLKAGESLNITCFTNSAPDGRVVLRRELNGEKTELASSEGTKVSFMIHFAELSDSGTYECEAVNKYGNQTTNVSVIVQAPPRNTSVKVLPSTWVHEGENVTICCYSVSFPPPAIVLRKLGSGMDIYSPNGTFLLVNLTPNDTERLSRPLPSWNDYIFSATGLGVLASMVGILEYLRRARRKGFYELSKCRPGTV